jgi:superfamily I DNA and/or RNA helicase
VDTGEPLGEVTIDEDALRVRIKVGPKRGVPPERLSIGPGNPIKDEVLRDALFRFADSVIAGSGRYPALEAFLRKDPPRIEGRAPGSPVVADAADIRQVIEAVAGLDRSCLFIQGPPGAGKTYSGSHVIVALLKLGKRVGVSSNSHKAINNLLAKVEAVAEETRVAFRGAKKSSGDDETRLNGKLIEDVESNDAMAAGGFQLVAGTAWLFSRPEFDQTLDYLFVDEAGQVAVANLVSMGTSARNVVLLGDQMQLGQPVQGVHPGRSGDSSLEYLLDGMATIPPARGVFLERTWRMHPNLCRFISDAVYDGRLQPARGTAHQRLVLGNGAHPELRPTGVRFVPAEHEGCRQRSDEEAAIVAELYQSLLLQPRNMEFLFSKNRLNVAISRARCLALVVASPKLLDVKCTTPEQMALVNTLCWVRNHPEAV